MGRGSRAGAAVLAGWRGILFALLAACAPRLELLAVQPKELGSIALNEELLLYFSDDLDRSSITSDSVRIVDDLGRTVSGEHVVRGNKLAFLPDLPRASDLSDGGLRPGSRYHVVLGGFPRVDGIRSVSGALLAATIRFSFRTAQVGGEEPLFLDPFLGYSALVPRVVDGGIVLECEEALDPSTVPGARFGLTAIPSGEKALLSARLVENRRRRAVLLLELGNSSVDGLAPGRYYLHPEDRSLRTLGGRVVEAGWELLRPLIVPSSRVNIDLARLSELSPEMQAGCDGTATWSAAEEALILRYPAAAGSGQSGEVALAAPPAGRDTHATRLAIAAGVEVDLSAVQGPLVLRSQTSIEVRGRLTRHGPGDQDDPVKFELERAAELAESDRPLLTAWVQRLLGPEETWAREPWTVLIAGGDIRVPRGGSIDVEGWLVLVAGGTIRAEGNVAARGNLWRTAEGGGMSSRAGLRQLPLVLDPPAVNPLRVALSVDAVTSSLSWVPGSGAWHTLLVGSEGGGRMTLRFLQSQPGAEREQWFEDPGQLGGGRMRVFVRFEMPPGKGDAWVPPRIERLTLSGKDAWRR
jgi:hypothetical protein